MSRSHIITCLVASSKYFGISPSSAQFAVIVSLLFIGVATIIWVVD